MHKQNVFFLIISIVGILLMESFLHAPVHALVPLTVQFGNPPESPLFSISNMAPGDVVTKQILVTNPDTIAQYVSIKGIRTGPMDQTNPLIEDILQIDITLGPTTLYSNTVQEFFNDSMAENGVPLSLIPDGDQETYEVIVTFPLSAGNEYQNKSVVFELVVGTVTSDSLVINEVYYEVDENHGYDSPKDRGIDSIGGNSVSVIISDNGAGSINTVNIALKDVCKITQGNNVNITNIVGQNGNTGNNTTTGGSTSTGFIQQVLSFFNIGGINIASCGKKLGQNHEWIELYNPTQEKISLKNWTLTDNSGNAVKLKNKSIKPGQFVLITKDSATWNYWNEGTAIKMNLGTQIGDGLDNEGDHLILKNANNEVIDYVAWGDDTEIWDPAVLLAQLGASIERIVLGLDTDTATDWDEQLSPTPGN